MVFLEEIMDTLGSAISINNNRMKRLEKDMVGNADKISHLEDEIRKLKKENENLKQENKKLKNPNETGSIDIFIKNYGEEAVK